MATESRLRSGVSVAIAAVAGLAAIAFCIYLQATLAVDTPQPTRAEAWSHVAFLIPAVIVVAILDAAVLRALAMRARRAARAEAAPESAASHAERAQLLTRDGRTFSLVRDHVIGRAPEDSEDVASGRATAVELADPTVSRVHAALRVADGRIVLVDLQSTNGTSYLPPGSGGWQRLSPGQEVALERGMVISAGAAELVYVGDPA